MEIFWTLVDIAFTVLIVYHWIRTDNRLDELESKED